MVLGTPGSLFALPLGKTNIENSYVKITVAEVAQPELSVSNMGGDESSRLG